MLKSQEHCLPQEFSLLIGSTVCVRVIFMAVTIVLCARSEDSFCQCRYNDTSDSQLHSLVSSKTEFTSGEKQNHENTEPPKAAVTDSSNSIHMFRVHLLFSHLTSGLQQAFGPQLLLPLLFVLQVDNESAGPNNTIALSVLS